MRSESIGVKQCRNGSAVTTTRFDLGSAIIAALQRHSTAHQEDSMSLQTRVVNIITKPKEEWPVIAAESTDVATLYKGYIAPLAAIPAIGSFIGITMVGVTVPASGTYRVGLASGLMNLIVSYVLSLVAIYIAAIIVEQLAPKFQSRGSTIQALKLVAYACTPAWIAGVLNIVPLLGILTLLAGLYAIYLFYVGLPVMMNTPPDKVIPYMLVSAVVIIVISILVSVITGVIGGVRPNFS
jgi:hypothetical protein